MSRKTADASIGFGGFLTLMFIAFKLLGVIHWSWWWVLSPIWLPVVVVLVPSLLIILVLWWRSR